MSEDLKSAEERWIERVGGSRVPLTPSVFPGDAVAIIYKPARSAMTSGKARTRQWKLRFEPRSSQYIEPLMAWTGRDDTLSQVELTFPSVEAAVAYARRQGLQFMVQGGAAAAASVRSMADSAPTGRRSPQRDRRQRRLEWVERTLAPDIIRNGLATEHDAPASYARPDDVLSDDGLSPAQKREVLCQWALEAYKIERGLVSDRSQPRPSRLEEVIDAMLDLDEAQGSARVGRGHSRAA
jgi:ETC complex I subunit-like protein